MRNKMCELRKKSGLKRKEIAKYIDCTESAVYYFEAGKVDMTWYHLSKYAKLMGLKTLEDLEEVMQDDGRRKLKNPHTPKVA